MATTQVTVNATKIAVTQALNEVYLNTTLPIMLKAKQLRTELENQGWSPGAAEAVAVDWARGFMHMMFSSSAGS